MKKLLVVSIIILSVFLIYLSTIDKKVYYLSLSTNMSSDNFSLKISKHLEKKDLLEKYVIQFNGPNLRITDFIKMIENNQTVSMNQKEQSIKNALIKADIVTLDIGRVDLFSKLAYEKDIENLYTYVDQLMGDMDTLLNQLRLYCKEDIFLLEIYNPKQIFPEEIITYVNDKLKVLSTKYKIHFVSYEITPDMVQDTIHLNRAGEEEVYQRTIRQIEKALFHK